MVEKTSRSACISELHSNGAPTEFILRAKKDLDEVDLNGVSVVRLASQDVITADSVVRILSMAPDLDEIRVSPSLHSRLVNPQLREFCESCDVGLVCHTDNPRRMPKLGPATQAIYQAKYEYFMAMWGDDNRKRVYEAMLEAGLRPAIIASLYFENGQRSIRDIAQELGIRQGKVANELNAFAMWLGWRTEDQVVVPLFNWLQKEIKKIENKL
jgi:hypothetical protein